MGGGGSGGGGDGGGGGGGGGDGGGGGGDHKCLGRQRQADLLAQVQPGLQSKFWDSQGYTEKPCFQTNKQTNKQTNEQTRGMAHQALLNEWLIVEQRGDPVLQPLSLCPLP